MPRRPPISPTRSALGHLVRPPLRADGRRSYEALLAAADEMFTVHGPGAPLDAIARRAGVSNATLYRHFPDRRDLLVAVCVTEVEALCALGEELLTDANGARALDTWLRTYVDHVRAKHGLAAAFASGGHEDSGFVAACQAPVAAVGAALLARAIEAGAVRPDVRLADVTTLLNAIAMATETTRDPVATEGLLAIVVNGIAPV
ncbi:TetR/AcrR family transcriptional regulator [Mycolicibacterium sp. P1-18]|uniref:TetR/AcrR family transcriptional regulator n=1 Tax=Mycolicibacterium sp. P1-18 TaxID=2024615 RepID=UPI0011F1F6A9|nr:TetR/AcrR family transcriptional regulator [Mycolicibacterium sp. P1-18]KAA0095997.1 TetR/AcrR family transcriptional regulator [Mycolicibacterium sp. P1-18]